MRWPERSADRIELTGAYAGTWIDVDDDAPVGALEDMQSSSVAKVLAALASVTVATNATARDGSPLDLSTSDGWRSVPKSFVDEAGARISETWARPLATRRASRPSSAATPPGSTTTSP